MKFLSNLFSKKEIKLAKQAFVLRESELIANFTKEIEQEKKAYHDMKGYLKLIIKNQVEEQEKVKAGALELQQDFSEKQQIYETTTGKLEAIIQQQKEEIISFSDALNEKTISANPLSVSDAMDENTVIKELKKRNGLQSDTILKLMREISAFKNKK